MDTTEKLTNNKQVIAYISERFPLCFTLVGEASPLKIGIFKDLAECLSDDPKVSKTQLRAALRQYTSSWRYLYGCKEGVLRVDLEGKECGALTQEHIEHAKIMLSEGKARLAERRKEHAEKNQDTQQEKKPKKSRVDTGNKPSVKTKNTKMKTQSPEIQPEPKVALKAEDVIVGKRVNVNMGNGNLPATIIEINKEEVRVRLENGLSMLVRTDHLCP